MQNVPSIAIREVGLTGHDYSRAILNPLTPTAHPALREMDRLAMLHDGNGLPAGPSFGGESVRERMATRRYYDSVG